MRVLLVHNTRAGDGLPPGELRRAIESAGHEVVREIAKNDGVLFEEGDGAELVAIAGGDGTVGDVTRAFAGKGIPLAVLPLGTANNVARSLGVAGEPEKIASKWSGETRRVRFDLGAAQGPWGQKRFLEGAGVGLVPVAIAAAHERGKKKIARSGGGPIEGARKVYLRALKTLKASRLAVAADGERLDGEYLLVQVLNTPCVGPNLALSPAADPGDGFLDLVLAGESEREALRALIEESEGGDASGVSLPVRRVRSVEISRWENGGKTGGAVHVDDDLPESAGAPAMALTVQPGQVEFLV